MLQLVVLFALVALSAAQFQRAPVPITSHQEVRDNHGQYSYSFATGDGAAHSDRGVLKPGPEGNYLVREGSHSYTSPEGQKIQLSYTADENGYQPTGAHLPVAPAPIAV